MRRLPLVILPALALAGVVFGLAFALPRILASQPYPVEQQPIQFDHQVHAGVLGIPCDFCHRTASTGPTAGMPDVQQCMFCHQTIGRGQVEIEKVRAAWSAQTPINWQRVHRLPDHVHFSHEAHVNAGVPCATCHGAVEQMHQVTQVRALNMADCTSCHEQNNAPVDCVTCHY